MVWRCTVLVRYRYGSFFEFKFYLDYSIDVLLLASANDAREVKMSTMGALLEHAMARPRISVISRIVSLIIHLRRGV